MLKIPGETNGVFCDGVSRRNFLQIGSLAMGGIALPELLRAEEALGSKAQKQKSVIMIFLLDNTFRLNLNLSESIYFFKGPPYFCVGCSGSRRG